MFQVGMRVRHRRTSAMGDGVVVSENRFGNVDVCWEFDRVRVIRMSDGRQFTNWCRSEIAQDLMIRN